MANEDPLFNNCIEPHSFCMRAMACDYCGASERKNILIRHLYGIQACDQHYMLGQRDCKADLAKNNQVRYADALNVSECAALFNALSSPFKVKRTSGVIDGDWNLRSEYDIFDPSFLDKIKNEWYIPVCKGIKGQDDFIKKSIPISWFLEPEVACEYSESFAITCRAAIEALDKGVYKVELDSFNSNVINSKPYCVAEHPNVVEALMPDGQIVRMLKCL